jgi:hypothetical protein
VIRHCQTCGTADGKFEENHPAGRVSGVPQTDLTVTLCVPCHKAVTRWQGTRWLAGHALPARFETWLGWSDMMRLASLRKGSGQYPRLVKGRTEALAAVQRLESSEAPVNAPPDGRGDRR